MFLFYVDFRWWLQKENSTCEDWKRKEMNLMQKVSSTLADHTLSWPINHEMNT